MEKPINADMYDWDRFLIYLNELDRETPIGEEEFYVCWKCWREGFVSAIGHTLRKETVVETLRRM